MGFGGLGLGAYKEGSSCSLSPNAPYLRVHFRLLFRLESCATNAEMARANWIQSSKLASSLSLVLSPPNRSPPTLLA
jgi:hypothetical protein